MAIGTVEVALAASFASLIWAGPLSVHLPRAIGYGLFAAMVVMIVTSLRGSAPGTVGSIQDIPAAILTTVAASIAGGLPAGSPATFVTVVVAVSLTSAAVGVFFWCLGRFRLGNLIRYMPYPVVGGFLGGTGVLLVIGSVGILTRVSPSLAVVPELLAPGAVARWLPGVVFALLLLTAARKGWHGLLIPALFVAAVAVFHFVRWATGMSTSSSQAAGWLLGPFPDGALWQPLNPVAVGAVDWSVVLVQAPAMATIVVFSALGLLLNAGGIELALRRDVDFDQELRAAGVANVLAGLGGGPPGYHTVSLSALARQMNAAHRLVGVVAGTVCGAALIIGADLLALFPRFVVGGLILFVGLSLAVEWLLDTWRRLPRAEYLLLVVIVTVIATRGFLPGVLVGLAAAVVLFLISYSKVSVVKHAFSADAYRSNVDRPEADYDHLGRHGAAIQVLALHGYLFFGTANALYEWVRGRMQDPEQPALGWLVLGFRGVSGLDSSALQSFDKIRSLADGHGVTVVATDLTERWRAQLEAAGTEPGSAQPLRVLPDVDRGVQWCEDELLAAREQRSEEHASEHWDAAASGYDITGLRPFLEAVEAPAGTILIRQGDRSDDLFLLLSGRLTAQLARDDGTTARLRTISPGSVVGELGWYLGSARTAMVVADHPSKVYRLSRQALATVERESPDVAAGLHGWLARLMARRIADDVRMISALLD